MTTFSPREIVSELDRYIAKASGSEAVLQQEASGSEAVATPNADGLARGGRN